MTKGNQDAARFVAMASRHRQCTAATLIEASEGGAIVSLNMRVEMPLDMKADGISASGVQVHEPVEVHLGSDYPWTSPEFFLRADFPRHFPHLQPDPVISLPRPCLVEGSQDEYFNQFGLEDSGVFHLLEQLAIWLRKAAVSGLIDPEQGWEPMLRREMANSVTVDPAIVRALVKRTGNWAFLAATYVRRGKVIAKLGDGATAFLWSDGQAIVLKPRDDKIFVASAKSPDMTFGSTVVAIAWPDKSPDGSSKVSAVYRPESIQTLGDLKQRASEYDCGRTLNELLSSLERHFASSYLLAPVPVSIILCVRRPVHLIGTDSPIELLPYVVEISAVRGRTSLFPKGDDEPVGPAIHLDTLSATLMRRVSGAVELPPLAMLGSGSVGSKLAMHAVRSGQSVITVSDKGFMQPHNLARHALAKASIGADKSLALADAIESFGTRPAHHVVELGASLRTPDGLAASIPSRAGIAINSTASLVVREALVAAASQRLKARLMEAALFARGRGGYLLIDGLGHNPNHADLMAEIYATTPPAVAALLFDPQDGLSQVQIGQGCGSLTMRIEDARLSAMTGLIYEEVARLAQNGSRSGEICLFVAGDAGGVDVARHAVNAFEVVEIQGAAGWTIRISPRVAARIRAEAAARPDVETGGLMIGVVSARLRSVTVVDVIDAPADSTRSSSAFVLGTRGLTEAILARHAASGAMLIDVGTWHSHLRDQGPSGTDWATAAALAAERTPPSILLIATPKRFHAIVHPRVD